MISTHQHERKIARALAKYIPAPWDRIVFSVYAQGSAYTIEGHSLSSRHPGKKTNIRDEKRGFLKGTSSQEESAFTGMVFAWHERSEREPMGPWYFAELVISRTGRVSASYRWEREQITSISQLKKHPQTKSLPTHPFRSGLSAKLLRQWPQDKLLNAIDVYTTAQLDRGVALPPMLLSVFAISDWIGDTRNGGLDQYFTRSHDWMTNTTLRRKLYPVVMQALETIGAKRGAALFRDGIALYAHHRRHIEAARVRLGIARVAKKDSDGITPRLHREWTQIEAKLSGFIRKNISEIATEE